MRANGQTTARSIEQVALIRGGLVQVAAGGEPASIPGARVPHNVFSLLGVESILGRSFLPEEEREGNDRVVILSESLWRTRFNADRLLLGAPVLLDGESHQVVGIVP